MLSESLCFFTNQRQKIQMNSAVIRWIFTFQTNFPKDSLKNLFTKASIKTYPLKSQIIQFLSKHFSIRRDTFIDVRKWFFVITSCEQNPGIPVRTQAEILTLTAALSGTYCCIKLAAQFYHKTRLQRLQFL